MLFGFGKWTAIVCPDRLWQQLSIAQRHAFLAHESAHYLRRDHWVRWIEWFIGAIYWWLPLIHIARRQLERHEEIACDHWAITRFGIKRRCYVETLLNVVDFLDETATRSPRLASRMQPTELLEQRVQLLLDKKYEASSSTEHGLQAYTTLAFGVVCLFIHPLPLRLPKFVEPPLTAIRSLENPSNDYSHSRMPAVDSELAAPQTQYFGSLPSVPSGWWNDAPQSKWASVPFPQTGARLTADTEAGMLLELAQGSRLDVSAEAFTCAVEIPDTGRVLFGDASGRLRLWDVVDGGPVSLIGRHAAEVTSLAIHPTSGVVAADQQGSAIRWDLKSGNPQATWTSLGGPIQCVRGCSMVLNWQSSSEVGEDRTCN